MPRTQLPVRSDSSSEFDLLPWEAALDRYGDSWTNIVDSRNLNPTHLPGWLDITIRSHRLPSPIEVVTLANNGSLQAALPVFYVKSRHFGLPFNTVELVTNSVSYHADLITTTENEAVLTGLFKIIRPCHLFRAANLTLNGSAMKRLQRYAAENGLATMVLPVEESPHLPITSDWNSFIASKNKKFRYKLRQRQKAVAADPQVSAVALDSEADTTRLYEEILEIESKSWKAKYHLDIQHREKERAYYSLLLPYLAQLGALHVDMLYYDDVPIAYSLCVNWKGWVGQLKTSFDERFSKLSPGAIVIDRSIKAAFDNSAREFDFLGDMDRHKGAWTALIRRHADVFIYNNKLKSRMLYIARKTKSRILPRRRIASVKPGTSS